MKLAEIRVHSYIDFDVEKNDKDPWLKVTEHVRISEYKYIFAKGYTQSWSEKVSVVKNVKNIVPRSCVIEDLKGKEVVGDFYERELQKTSKTDFKITKVLKREKKTNYMPNGRAMISHYSIRYNIKMNGCFPEPRLLSDVKVQIHLSYYGTKAKLKLTYRHIYI